MRSSWYVVLTSETAQQILTAQEIMSDSTLGRYTLKPKMRVQKAEVSTKLIPS